MPKEAPLLSWPAALKPHYVRVISMEITGPGVSRSGSVPDRDPPSPDDRLQSGGALALIPGAVFQNLVAAHPGFHL